LSKDPKVGAGSELITQRPLVVPAVRQAHLIIESYDTRTSEAGDKPKLRVKIRVMYDFSVVPPSLLRHTCTKTTSSETGINTQQGVSTMSTEQNKALIRRFYEEGWNEGNVAVVAAPAQPVRAATVSAQPVRAVAL
jgi:hypothetical protein